MKKAIFATSVLILILSISAYTEESNVGYKDFNLGQTKQTVKTLIKGKYSNVKFAGNEDMTIETGEMVYSKLFFDLQDILYYLQIEIKAGDISKVKQRLLDKYGQPNDYSVEEFSRSINSHLMGRWLIDKRYKIALWENEDCRSSKMNPCIIFVDYIDLKLRDAKAKHEEKLKIDAQKKKDGKTYDGF